MNFLTFPMLSISLNSLAKLSTSICDGTSSESSFSESALLLAELNWINVGTTIFNFTNKNLWVNEKNKGYYIESEIWNFVWGKECIGAHNHRGKENRQFLFDIRIRFFDFVKFWKERKPFRIWKKQVEVGPKKQKTRRKFFFFGPELYYVRFFSDKSLDSRSWNEKNDQSAKFRDMMPR